MTRPNETPLTPASLATDGNKGAGANTRASDCGAQHSPQQAAALTLALLETDAALLQLNRYALVTDTPARGVVEAADLLDAARAMLAQAVTR